MRQELINEREQEIEQVQEQVITACVPSQVEFLYYPNVGGQRFNVEQDTGYWN